MRILKTWVCLLAILLAPGVTLAATAGTPGNGELTIVLKGRTNAWLAVSPDAGPLEKKAAADLLNYIEMMSGAKLAVADNDAAIQKALAGSAPVIVLGEVALKANPALRNKINGVLKKNPKLQTEGIGLVRQGNKVFVAGNSDRAHYYAAADLLWKWGCRWYLPTEFGECVPVESTLTVGDLDYAWSSPFEIRSYWIAWVGDNAGKVDFQLRNMMQHTRSGMPSTGHALGKYTNGAPGAKATFNFPITAPETAAHVASKVEDMFAKGNDFSIGMEDGSYDSDYPKDQELMKLQYDKYFMRTSVTDPMLELYNNVARILQKKYPNSDAKMGFLAYANMTIPPVRDMKAEPSLWCELAPIDFDPNHGMDDPDSPPRQEYRDFMYEWAKVMDGRLSIYDYDQGMLVWRDIPNPSHQAFRQDVKHYAMAGILGVNTESRNAIGTVFLNLFLRGRLMWNPNADVDGLLEEFYPNFYGPAAAPMSDYWSAIYDAWDDTIITEHEHFAIPAIYTPELVSLLSKKIVEAEKAVASLATKSNPTRNEKLYLDRIKFTRMSYDIIAGYTSMVDAAATDVDYAMAVPFGEKALAVRENMTDMSGTFTTYRKYGAEKNINNAAWWPGEVNQYRKLNTLVNGEKGKLITKLPLAWAFHRDNDDTGLAKGYHTKPVDLTYWNANKASQTIHNRKDYPVDQWEMINTNLYAQAQGIRHPDYQSYTGQLWYRTSIELNASQLKGNVHVMFPGLFNECTLYVNGKEVGTRTQNVMWWYNSYSFEWDVDLSAHLKAGENTITLKANNPHHFGGMFRRPFLYQPVGE